MDILYYLFFDLYKNHKHNKINLKIFLVVLSEQFIRLAGIDAPESRCRRPIEKKLGLLAKERLAEILKDTFKLKSLGKGKFGRILGIPYVDNVDVCSTLITEGHAVEYEGGKKTKVWGE